MVCETYHREIVDFFSIESQCDLQGVDHSSNQRDEDDAGEYLLELPLAFPIQYHPPLQLPFFHEEDTYNNTFL